MGDITYYVWKEVVQFLISINIFFLLHLNIYIYNKQLNI